MLPLLNSQSCSIKAVFSQACDSLSCCLKLFKAFSEHESVLPLTTSFYGRHMTSRKSLKYYFDTEEAIFPLHFTSLEFSGRRIGLRASCHRS